MKTRLTMVGMNNAILSETMWIDGHSLICEKRVGQNVLRARLFPLMGEKKLYSELVLNGEAIAPYGQLGFYDEWEG